MTLKSNILCILLLTNFTIADVGDDCEPNNQLTEGICTLITDCEVAIRALKNKGNHGFERCGFEGNTEIVCCPKTTEKFGADKRKTPKRIADRECDKILDANIVPLGLYIIDGEAASLGEFPHMVAIGFDRGNGYVFDCGGSLVSKTFVITAAHCVDTLDKIQPSIVRGGVVEIGGSEWNSETDFRITELILHPDYKRKEKYHDIALLRLEKPARFSSYINAVCLYTDAEDPRKSLTITGWGRTSTSRDIKSNILLKTKVSVVGRERCSESYTGWRKLPEGISTGQLCAGDTTGDTCQGDSGGPLQVSTSNDVQYRLVGITSFGRGCGSSEPGVYTRISHYIDWIENVVWKN